MEKYLIASDLHGSAPGCERLLDALKREGTSRLILLGDLLYHGPRNPLPEGYDPKRVAELLNGLDRPPLCVRGNCDAEVDQVMLRFPILSDYAWLALGDRTVFLTHGHLPLWEHAGLRTGDLLVSGHTHRAVAEVRDGIVYANPGSPALPKDGYGGSYLVLHSEGLSIRTMDGKEILSLAFHLHSLH